MLLILITSFTSDITSSLCLLSCHSYCTFHIVSSRCFVVFIWFRSTTVTIYYFTATITTWATTAITAWTISTITTWVFRSVATWIVRTIIARAVRVIRSRATARIITRSSSIVRRIIWISSTVSCIFWVFFCWCYLIF